MNPPEPRREPLGAWRRTYVLVILAHLVWIAALYVVTRSFPR